MMLMLSRLKVQMFVMGLGALCSLSVQANPPDEYEVETAFIHNIAKFIEWPDRAAGTLTLCVLGQNPFGNALSVLQGKSIADKVWEVLPIGSSINLNRCDVLFISASEKNALGQILAGLQGRPVLTMGNTTGYAEQGVMVNFYLEQNRVHFEINNDSAVRAGFRFGSQLLKLARIVAGSGGKN